MEYNNVKKIILAFLMNDKKLFLKKIIKDYRKFFSTILVIIMFELLTEQHKFVALNHIGQKKSY